MKGFTMTVAVTDLISNEASEYKLLFVHGFMGGPHGFAPMISRLATALASATGSGPALSAVGVTLPGHRRTDGGTAPIGRELTLASYADNLAEWLNSEAETLDSHGGQRKLIVYGYSMGGRIAAAALLSPKLHPGAVAGLILESSGLGLASAKNRQERLERDRQLLAGVASSEDFARFLRGWYRLPLFRGLRQTAGYEAMIEERLRQDPVRLQQAVEVFSVGHQDDMAEALRALAVPMLYVAGAEDAVYVEHARRLGRPPAPKQMAVDIIEDASHSVHLQQPDRLAARVAAFLTMRTKKCPVYFT